MSTRSFSAEEQIGQQLEGAKAKPLSVAIEQKKSFPAGFIVSATHVIEVSGSQSWLQLERAKRTFDDVRSRSLDL